MATKKTNKPKSEAATQTEPASSSKVVRLHLVPRKPNVGAVDSLKRLLKEAEQGYLDGIAFAALYVDKPNQVGGAGCVWESTVFVRGMLAELSEMFRR
jgi:hypothetical protein